MMTRRFPQPAVGKIKGSRIETPVILEVETFNAIREMAIDHHTSMAEMIRTVIEWGMDSVGDD